MNQQLLKAQIDNLYGLCDQIAFNVGVAPHGWGTTHGTKRDATSVEKPRTRRRQRRRNVADISTTTGLRGRQSRART